jgi:hypothetical protein
MRFNDTRQIYHPSARPAEVEWNSHRTLGSSHACRAIAVGIQKRPIRCGVIVDQFEQPLLQLARHLSRPREHSRISALDDFCNQHKQRRTCGASQGGGATASRYLLIRRRNRPNELGHRQVS